MKSVWFGTDLVDLILQAYFQLFCGAQSPTLKTWGEYIDALQKVRKAAKGSAPVPSEKTLSELQQMKDDYRNPIMHPRVVLKESDARMLFNNGESLIIAMAQEIASSKSIQPSLALVPPAGAAAATP